MKDIQEWFEHSDIGTTMNIYTHLRYKSKEGIADVIESSMSHLKAPGKK